MPTIEEDLKKLVNINKVAKAVKDIGRFALCSLNEETNLLITGYFILNLTEGQFWEIQCKLLAKKTGVWFHMSKEGLIEEKPVSEDETGLYFRTVKNQTLQIIGWNDLYLGNIMIYAAEEGAYVGVKRHHVDMLGDVSALKQARVGSLIVAADVHVLTPMKEIESEYLVARLF